MDLDFTQSELFDEEPSRNEAVTFLSKTSGIEDAIFDNVVQIIDETGNEVNCTIEKFIEIFDTHGLEGFIL